MIRVFEPWISFSNIVEVNKALFKNQISGSSIYVKKFEDAGILDLENILIDSFASKNEYFSHRRAKKLGENDYGRCISMIKKTNSQN